MVSSIGVEIEKAIDELKLDREPQVEQAEAETREVFPPPIDTIRKDVKAFEKANFDRLLLRYSGEDVLPDGWREGPAEDGIQVVYGEVKNSAWYTMKTTGKLSVSAEKAVKILAAPEMVPKFDDMTKEVRPIEKLSDKTEIRVVSCKAIMFTTARDFCVATTVHKLDDGRYIITTRSVDHPNGEQKGYVRALSYISGYVLTPIEGEEDACEISVLAHMDLGGSLPAMVVRYVGLSAPIKLIKKIQEVCLSEE
jgi:hypothetical protein